MLFLKDLMIPWRAVGIVFCALFVRVANFDEATFTGTQSPRKMRYFKPKRQTSGPKFERRNTPWLYSRPVSRQWCRSRDIETALEEDKNETEAGNYLSIAIAFAIPF